jgi:hypothetical protein
MLSLRAQAAMEYLTTYGWMILVVVGVVSALYYLGVFNGGTYAARALPGACEVFRPYGAGSQQLITLQGVCNDLEPKSVAQFNGQTGYIAINSTGGPSLNYDPITIAAWVYPTTPCLSQCQYVIGKSAYGGFIASISGNFRADIHTNTADNPIQSPIPAYNKWYYVVETYDGTTMKLYINGMVANSQTLSVTPVSSNGIAIGTCLPPICGSGNNQFFTGSIADVQIYNASLSANEINELYLEGIGGAPIRLQNIVGWWPLNGDTKDYSGNGNNGAASSNGVAFTTSWTSGYVPP